MPHQIRDRKFVLVRRGYDRTEVEEFLKQISAAMAQLLEQVAVVADGSMNGAAVNGLAGVSDIDAEAQLAAMEDIEARAAQRLKAASLEADRLRTEARRVLEKANREAQETLNLARSKADKLTTEAQQAKQRTLGDLMVRRKEAQAHVEMLRAARDELLASFAEVQQLTAQAMEPLDGALERAKAAADKAVQKFRDEQAAEQGEESAPPAKLKARPAAKPAAEPVANAAVQPAVQLAADAEPVIEPVAESDADLEPGLEPDLSNIFARLRQEEPSEPVTEAAAEAASQAAQAAVDPSAEPVAELEPQPLAIQEVPEPAVELEPEPATPEPPVPAGAANVASNGASGEELLRQLKRALTQDESRVLRAVHKFNGKPSKLKALKRTILEDSPRQAFLAEYLREAEVSAEVLEQTMTIPLTQELNACDWQHTDLKFLVQQVRDIYRQFAAQQLAAAKTALANADQVESTA